MLSVVGRPSTYSEKVSQELCDRLIQGKSITAVCDCEDMPAITTVFRWLQDNETFREKYSRARDLQADVFAAQTIDIADEALIGVKTVNSVKDGLKTYTGDNTERSRLMIESRKWTAAKIAPLRYGERIQTQMLDEHGKPARSRVIVIVDGAPGEVRGVGLPSGDPVIDV